MMGEKTKAWGDEHPLLIAIILIVTLILAFSIGECCLV